MIGNPVWFSPRKYSGWGMTPNCWQGWLYIAFIALPIAILGQFTLPGNWSTYLMFAWSSIFVIDFIDIFSKMKRDERDIAHEALAERNAMWFVITTLAFSLAYQAAAGVVKGVNQVDPIILIALFGALFVKAVTNFYLRDK
ncbi:hypothetical protein HYV64_00025 [Candidatus Shapirobacteria bacterium]|nr:hypothetical protein [Candidatus Shapirobacteria bacterium]